ncbi:uncharacterized protein BDV14DRAFT_199666 [Aspergillus stella-maris]|uniref:uncharacterized protein n=1 Tax=Aspergillus stella-maris TaxID=1810926 RepID=UPI003CCDCFAF
MSNEMKSCPPAEHVAKVLDKKNIDNVFFGLRALDLVGRAVECDQMLEFVVPDEQLNEAIEVLKSENIEPCNDSNCIMTLPTCGPNTSYWWREFDNPEDEENAPYILCPAAHFHTEKLPIFSDGDSPTDVLILNKKSETIWWLPDFNIGESITLTNDSALPAFVEEGCEGPWPADSYGVKILKPSAFTEAVIRLLAFHLDLPVHNIYHFMLTCVMDLRKDDGTDVKKGLDERFRKYWSEQCRNPFEVASYKALSEIRGNETKSGQFPTPLERCYLRTQQGEKKSSRSIVLRGINLDHVSLNLRE